jgi:hypothetical protein
MPQFDLDTFFADVPDKAFLTALKHYGLQPAGRAARYIGIEIDYGFKFCLAGEPYIPASLPTGALILTAHSFLLIFLPYNASLTISSSF